MVLCNSIIFSSRKYVKRFFCIAVETVKIVTINCIGYINKVLGKSDQGLRQLNLLKDIFELIARGMQEEI